MPPGMEKKYGSYKVSEFSHGKDGYKLTDPNSYQKHSVEGDEFFNQNDFEEDADYKKRFTLKSKKEAYKSEYMSSKDAMKEFSPF